jgi:hypothetical protein
MLFLSRFLLQLSYFFLPFLSMKLLRSTISWWEQTFVYFDKFKGWCM